MLQDIDDETRQFVQSRFEHANPQHERLKRMGIRFDHRKEPRKIVTWRDDGQWLSLPRGGMRKTRELLLERGYALRVKDERIDGYAGITDGFEWPAHKRTLFPDQETALAAILERETCYLRSPTGAGKSTIGIALVARVKVPSIVIVWTGALFDQWVERVEQELGLSRKWIGEVRGSKKTVGPITIAMQQSLARMKPGDLFFRFFGLLIFDECFVDDAPVLMHDGVLKRIADVEVGDVVAVGGRVRAIMRRTFAGRLVRTGTTWSTPDHPVATTRGWRSSESISSDDVLWDDPLHEMRRLSEGSSSAQQAGPVQDARLFCELRSCRGEVPSLRQDRYEGLQRVSCDDEVRVQGTLEQRGDRGDERIDSANVREAEGPEETCACCEDTPGLARSCASSSIRARDYARAEEAIRSSGRAREEQAYKRAGKDRRGAGREQSFAQEAGRHGCQEGLLPEVDRVAGASLPGAVRLEAHARRGQAASSPCVTCDVYNLETEEGVYVAGGVLVHNCQRASAPTFMASTDPFPARYRIGISADERRADKKEFLAHDLFGDLALEIKRTDLVAQGRVRDVEVRLVPTAWRLPEEALLGSAGDQHRKMLDAMALARDRDALVVDLVKQELERDEQILVFSLRVEHCRRLVGELADAGVAAGLMLGGVENRQQLKEAVDGMRAGRMRVAVGTVQAVGTGVDLPSVGVGVVAMPVASNRQLFGQVAGRVCRTGGGSGPARLYCLADSFRARDWSAYFSDNRPVLVRSKDGTWIDARQDKRRAKAVAFPAEQGGIFGWRGDDEWRTK